tara:strand:+ start:136 stop:357 length:222 start_codon:yes stop_codon:yes gene_type:complete
MTWKDIVKVDKKDEQSRWKRYQLSQKKGGFERKPNQPRYKCGMCGSRLSRYNKEHKRNQINYCKKCKEARGKS